MTQRALAATAGINHVTLWRIETGRFAPNELTLYKIAAALGVDVEELLPDGKAA